ncbi:MAG: 2-oxoglutarate dehydrogenase E1 component, partial [Pseudomonadota bacterium]
RKIDDVTIIRVENLYPFPAEELAEEVKKYPNADVIWCQEEAKNMGYWTFVDRLIEDVLITAKHKITRPVYIGRDAAASPATGHLGTHNTQQVALIDAALTLK